MPQTSDLKELISTVLSHPYAEKVFYMLIVTLVVWVAIRVCIALSDKISAKIQQSQGRHIKALRIQNVTFITEGQLAHYMITGLAWFKKFVILVLAVWWLASVIALFAPVEYVAHDFVTLLERLVSNGFNHALEYLPNLALIAVVAVSTIFVLKWIKLFFRETEKGSIRFENFHP